MGVAVEAREGLVWLSLALVLNLVLFFIPPLYFSTPPPPKVILDMDIPSQLALYEAGSACGNQYLEMLQPMPLPTRVCPRGALSALAHGTREPWDGPFSLAPGCALKWFTAEEACRVLERVGALYIVGDSLLRHLTQALEAVLSGDLELGASIRAHTTGDSCMAHCACNGAYEDANGVAEACAAGHCPREASASWLASKALPFSAQIAHACPSWSRKRLHFKFVVFTASDTSNAGSDWRFDPAAWAVELNELMEEAAADAANTTGTTGVTVLLSPPSSHLGYTEAARQLIESDFISPVVAAMQESMAARGTADRPPSLRLLCMGMSARQNNKPEYLELQGNQHVVPYNEWLAQACAGGSGESGLYAGMIDHFALTLNHTSLDGAHYDGTVNVPLAQVLLNVLEEDLIRP